MKPIREVSMIKHVLLSNYLAVTGQEPSENYISQMECLLLLNKKKNVCRQSSATQVMLIGSPHSYLH